MLTQKVRDVLTEAKDLEKENMELKKTIEILKVEVSSKREKPQACEYCKFFRQHYALIDGEYRRIYAGHCARGRIKDRRPDATCDYFEMR